jgi:aspartyl-tRNA(Asn)/glutamyl-tRNA(Gln) amidotransferase subunit B
LNPGGKIDQETRLFDANTGETRTMRSKEDANDYRYFPDPDLLPLKLEQSLIDTIAKDLPELPDAKINRYVKDFGLAEYDAAVLCDDKIVADFFEESISGVNAKMVANWITSELFGMLNKENMDIADSRIKPKHINQLVSLIEKDIISGKIAKQVFEEMFSSGDMPEAIIEAKGLVQVSDEGQIRTIIEEVIKENPDSVAGYKSGKGKLFGFFVGQVMKKSAGKANPTIVNNILKELLG